jgi:hypothetical protein
MWIAVRDHWLKGLIVKGPFPTAARASGYGWSRWGSTGVRDRWYVLEVTR